MTAADFPNSPIIGDLFTVDGITRKWDGVAWSIVPTTISGPPGAPGTPGIIDATFPLDYDTVNKTVFMAPADNGKFLKSTGSGFTWDSAAVTIANDTATNSSLYPIFTSTTSGTITSANVSQSKLFYNPSTGALAADSFVKNGGMPSEFLKADGSVESIPTFANYKVGYDTQVAVASPSTTLTATSNRTQYFTGNNAVIHKVSLPSTSTLVLGQSFELDNRAATADIDVQTSTGVSIYTIAPGLRVLFTCISTASNASSSWTFDVIGFSNVTGTGVAVRSIGATITSPSISNGFFTSSREPFAISSTAPTGTIAYDLSTTSNVYRTTAPSANWTINFRWSSTAALSTALAVGESITATFLATTGATTFYPNVIQVDGTTSGISVKWQGGSPITTGNASSIDAYTFVILRTGTSAYTVFASQVRWQP